MVKVRYYLTVTVCTLALALPAGLMALAIAAFFDRYTTEIGASLVAFYSVDSQALASIRWPELAGMIIGMALLVAFLLFAGGQTTKQKLDSG